MPDQKHALGLPGLEPELHSSLLSSTILGSVPATQASVALAREQC